MTLLTVGRRRADAGTVYPPPDIDPGSPADYPLPASGTLTSIPTYEGSGKTIHPSVVDMGGKLSGYRWWLADTPYPYEQDTYENPSIWASNDRINWTVPAGVTNPLTDDPDGPGSPGFNSDTELIWDADHNRLVVYWRDYIPTRTPQMYYRAATSPNGNDWTLLPSPVTEMSPDAAWLSPAIWRSAPGEWRMWCFGGPTKPAQMWTAPTSLGPWSLAGDCTIAANDEWHGDIIGHNGVWFGIFSTRPITYPMVSSDGLVWTVGPALAFGSYRPTLLPSTQPGELDVWSSDYATQRVTYRRLPETIWTDLLP